MTGVELPALRGDNVLGFMAALGVLRLLDQELGAARSTLCWPNGAHSAAVIETSVATDVDSLAARLFDVVEGCKESGELVPGVAGLPLSSSGGDPMNKLSFRDGRGLSQSFADNDVAAEWLATMVGVSGPDENDELSRSRWWSVGPGPVTIAGTLAKALDAIKTPDDLAGALHAWQRHDWVAGYFDHAADVAQERHPGSRRKDAGVKAGVVGAAWLALMATRMFPVRARPDGRVETVAWRVADRRSVFTMPIWELPRGRSAVAGLIDHPALSRDVLLDAEMRGLGVGSVWRSHRMRSGNNNAAMSPASKAWPTSTEAS